MNPRLFVKLVLASALIGLPMGFLHQVWWLVMPPIVFGAYFFGSTVLMDANRSQYGATTSMMLPMLTTNIAVTAWNSVVQTAIFLTAWVVSLLIS